jgi:hypothetical protein
MTDIFSLVTSASWQKLNHICTNTAQTQKTCQNRARFHAIHYLSLAPYSATDGFHHLEVVANEDAISACSLALYRASLLFAYKHIVNKDFQRAHEECFHATNYLQEGLSRLEITTELQQIDLAARARCLVNSLVSQAELQEARTKNKIASHLVFILGMHRSGTSALTGMLAKAGFAAPSDLMPATVANPKGYWESLSIIKLNDEFIIEMESHWSSSLPLPAGWSESISARKWRTSLINLISEAYGGSELPVIKDPRFCKLLIGLKPWLESRLIETSFIIPIRHPLEVSNSLLQAEGVDLYKALRLWIDSTFMTEQATRGRKRKFIIFDILIQDPTNALVTCLKLVKSPFAPETTASLADCRSVVLPEDLSKASSFIDKNLRRQQAVIMDKELTEINNSSNKELIHLAEEVYQAIIANITDDQGISRALDDLRPSILGA